MKIDRGRRSVRVRPGVERVEGRELLSSVSVILNNLRPPYDAQSLLLHNLAGRSTTALALNPSSAVPAGTMTPAPAPVAAHAPVAAQAPVAASTPNTGGTTLPQGNGFTGNTNSPLLGSGTPTPHELAREAFRGVFNGRYYTSPGRFSDQGTTYYYRGTGGSSFFLHGDFNMAIVTPVDPNGVFVGEAVLNDKSTNSAGVVGLVLIGDRDHVDAQGRPTRMTFTADPNIYSGALSVAAAEGTVDITYGANHAIKVVFNGRIYTSGLTNPLVNQDLYARGGRPLKQHGPAALSRVR